MTEMTKEEKRERLQVIIHDLADDFRTWVSEVESSVAVTHNHYGRYLNMISMVAKGDKSMAIVVGEALKTAGANKCGVNAAMRIYVG